MATTSSLVVELDAKVSKYNRKMEQAEGKTRSVGKASAKAAKSITSIAVAAGIAATAIGAVVVASTAFAREVTIAANRAGETVERMQSLAFATNTVGISLEKLGDISKDTNEKIGEFLTTGGGGFKDFVDVLGLSSEEARSAAEEFQNLSGPDVLQAMVTQMEAAGVSGQQMSFALEGVASDATDLIPLLEDNGKALGNLTDQFDELGLALTADQLQRIKDVGAEFSKLTSTVSSEGSRLVADYSDEIIIAINAMLFLGTKTIDAFNLIATGWGNLIELSQAGLDDLLNGTDTFGQTLEERTKQTQEAIAALLGTSNEVTSAILKGGKVVNNKGVVDDKRAQDIKLKNLQTSLKAASVLNEAFFEDNKAINAGLIVADTAAGIMRALAKQDYAGAALTAAIGLAQLSANNSASKGGGGGGSAPPAQAPQQQNFEPETASLDLSEATESGINTLRVEFATDSGDQLMDAIAQSLNDGQRRGQF